MSGKGSQEEILRLFRRKGGDYLSGEEISQGLGVSRTAVWKHIRQLRDQGYTIEAVPSKGYRLAEAPDRLLPAEIQAGLETQRIGREVVYFEETDSTNLRAHELGAGGYPDGTVIIADRQSAGKGRLGRRWASPEGVNLYTSVLLRPDILPFMAPQLTFLSAVAVARAIGEASGLQPRVKWPNDVLLSGKKVAGLLNEMHAETEGIHYVILGIGVNLNMRPEQFPGDLRYPATSVAIEKGSTVSRTGFARCLYREIDRLYERYLAEGVAPIIREWEGLCDLVGRQVEVDCQQRIIRGLVTGLDEDGALLVRTAEGTEERILAGDVRPMKGE
ncbi:bifunctional ligase/repressor BirA [Desulfuromonas versatilis]|uniref:Bifunctional ligase/repressor BirA n=1 Tax=Desulfuromonas versatilis TaxID=2802975 RepID=A0ABN6DXG7_9BACT|nr:biotin--[acetyl-CoA-carboxylase] ligase [Desulfuromonas versatilis]BCR04507.1 bifunctional ligase/repressor BirA [Desulfuromonas versatilis]